MGIPAGITLIVGGAFHGKTTLLDAIASGIDPHPPGAGRERVAVLREAVSIRAEEGRPVARVDLSPFLMEIPSGTLAGDFSSERAGGSVAQAASFVEAIELGARVVLVDEDTSAMNLLVRDGRMQRLVPRPAEPIVPLIDRVRELYERFGVSTILATGSSGDYLEVADTVIRMNGYRAEDATARAREIATATRAMRLRETLPPLAVSARRAPRLEGKSKDLKTGLHGPRAARIGDEAVDLAGLSQISETGQVRAIGALLREAAARMEGGADIAAVCDDLEKLLEEAGLDALDPPAAYDLSRPRRFEIGAALNRWRSLRFRRPDREAAAAKRMSTGEKG
jgi:predicted ABC-class ATPase